MNEIAKLAAKWRERAKAEAVRADRPHQDDATTNWYQGRDESFTDCADELEAAIAAAPTPTPEAQGVGGGEWPAVDVASEHSHIPCAKYPDLFEYHLAISGEGDHAYTWSDKPHRLVYNLTSEVAHLRDRITALSAQPRPNPCKCVDCNGTEPRHSNDCTYMAELHGQPASAPLQQEGDGSADASVWTLIGLMERVGGTRDAGEEGDFITMSLDQVYALGALLTAHGCDPGWVDSAPASAPVGVAVGWPKQDAFGNLDFDYAGDRPTDADHASLAEGEAFVPVYLAHQPAAVDDAMERLQACPKLWYSDLVGDRISQLRMRAIVTAALAQPQGEG